MFLSSPSFGKILRAPKNYMAVVTLLYVCLSSVPMAQAKDFGEYGKVTADLRIRYERVDDESRPRDGIANTARLRLGYQTPEWNGLYAFGELETIHHLGATKFNDGLNGKTQFAGISDPEMNGINQLYVDYTMDKVLHARLGRQPLALDNQRFVSWSKTRQNDTTHDAGLVEYDVTENAKIFFAHSMGLHRFSGGRSTAGKFEGNLNLLNIRYQAPYDIAIAGYSYWLDFDGVPAEQALSSQTQGLRLTWEPKGDGWKPVGAAEIAHQQDFGHSNLNYDENYFLIEGGLRQDDLKIVGTVEQLGGNGKSAMQTPIGSAHSLTGYTDKFSTTPADGLRDHRVTISAPFDLPWEGQSIEATAQYHHFTDDRGDQTYGQEMDLNLTYKPVKGHAVSVKYGDYHADEFSSDVRKIIVAYEFKF